MSDGIQGLSIRLPVLPGVTESREEVLERHCLELKARLAETTRVLADATRELSAEILRREERQTALLHAQKLETLGYITSSVAHDFGNVLHTIQTGYEVLVLDPPSSRQQMAIDHGRRAVEQGLALTRRLLVFARREKTAPEIVAPGAFLNAIGDMVRHVLRSDITWDINVDENAWPVTVDVNELEMVLLNLAVNARDAMEEGGQLIIAAHNNSSVAASRPDRLQSGDYVVFSVSDTGTGMTNEVLAHATEPFYTTKNPDHGTGLGLASASTFAVQHGGALVIDSDVGRGTTVRLYLPRAAAETTEVQVGDLGRRGIILLAEESDTLRLWTAKTLRTLGYHVIEAANVRVALALSYSAVAIDLALVSATLPDGGGVGLADRLYVERPKLPVLFLGTTAVGNDAPVCTALGRPFNAAELGAAVSALLADGAAHRERETTLSARMMARLRIPELQELYAAWRQLRGCDLLPRVDDIQALVGGQGDRHFIAAVDQGDAQPLFRLVSVGRTLTSLLDSPLEGASFAGPTDDVVGSLAAAYAQTVRSRLPIYDWLRHALDDGPPIRFDRLILPMSEDGCSISHLLGVVVFTDFPQLKEPP